MRKTILTIAGSAALMSLLTVSAATPIMQSQTSTSTREMNHGRRGKQGGMNMMGFSGKGSENMKDLMAQDLATVLGITKEAVLASLTAGKTPQEIIFAQGKDVKTIEASLDTLRQTRMNEKLQAEVVAGKISQAKADEIKAKMLKREQDNADKKAKMSTDKATILGMTSSDMDNALASGKTLDTLITAKGMTRADFDAKLLAKRKDEMNADIQARVDSGKITQAEALAIKAKLALRGAGGKGIGMHKMHHQDQEGGR